jgi:uncharacterized BrkB/YihY/UPF0761 family membrane protein
MNAWSSNPAPHRSPFLNRRLFDFWLVLIALGALGELLLLYQP